MQNAAGFVESNENYKVEAEAEEKKPEPSALEKFWKVVRDNPSDFTGWTYLLQYVEQQVRPLPVFLKLNCMPPTWSPSCNKKKLKKTFCIFFFIFES